MRGDFHLGDWLVQPQLNLLSRAGRSARVEPKAMQVLQYLAEHPDEVVSKRVLKEKVWADTHVTDDVLVRCVSELRRALEDDPKEPLIIQTIPRGGYRLISPVGPTWEDETAPAVARKEPAAKSEDIPAKRANRVVTWATAGALVLSLLLVFLARNSRIWPFNPAGAGITSVAVLPLRNFSGDPEQDYFADAMTDALITDLAHVQSLQVASRTSVMRYKSASLPASKIAKELKVDALVEGSVMPVGDRVRITAQLIDGRTDRHLWSNTYERDYKDILFLQKDVVRAIVEEVRTTLTPVEEQRLMKAESVNPKAYEAYVKGRYFWNQRSKESLEKAVAYFEESVRLSPDFVLGYSGLADTYSLLAHYGFRDPEDSYRRSKEAARKALSLNAGAAEPHTSLALASMSYDRDWRAAEAGFRKSIQLNPRYATAHHWLALCLLGQAKREEAIVEAEKARELDPVSLAPNAFLAQCLLLARQYERAVEVCLATLELHPRAPSPRIIMAECKWRQGKVAEAVREIDKVKETWVGDPGKLVVTRALMSGDSQSARTALLELLRRFEPTTDPIFYAQTHALLGQKDEAFHCLELALQRRDSSLLLLMVDPAFDGLKNDVRFTELARRLGLTAET